MNPQIPILTPIFRWECPNCDQEDVTHEPQPHTRYHDCAGLRGLSAPMVPAGTKGKCRVRANVREDYIGKETVQYDGENTPIMAIETIRDDGSNDIAVLAPSIDSTGKVKE